jgi:hypothetical protein
MTEEQIIKESNKMRDRSKKNKEIKRKGNSIQEKHNISITTRI